MNALQPTQQYNNKEIIQELVERYLQHKEGLTITAYRKGLNKFFTWVENENHTTIQPDTLHSYRMWLQSSDLKVNTINSYISPLTNFFKWCHYMDYLPYDPSKYLKKVKHKDTSKVTKARSLTSSEVTAILGVTSKGNLKDYSERIMILCIFNLGLRIHEILKLKLSDIDLSKGIIKVLGKGSKLRTLGINPNLLVELELYLNFTGFNDDNYLINTVKSGINTKPGTIQHGNRVLKRLAVKANVDTTGISSHSGRVTAINHLLDKDTPIRDVANFAGHSDVNTTRIYDRKSLAKVVETCNILNFTDDE